MIATLKRGYLIGLLVLTALTTLIIACVVLFGGGGYRWMEMAVESGVGIGYLLVLSFAAYNAFDHRLWRIPAVAGAAVAALMMILLPIFAYLETNRHYSAGDAWLYRNMGYAIGTGLTTAGLLCLAPFILGFRMKMPGSFFQLCTAVGYVVLYITFQFTIWGRNTHDLEVWFTLLFILCGAGTLTVVVLHRFFGIKVPNPLSTVAGSIHLTCPRCRKDQEMNLGDGRCAFCKLRIKIEVEEPLCPTCGYNLHTLTHPVCPECGTRLLAQEIFAEPKPA